MFKLFDFFGPGIFYAVLVPGQSYGGTRIFGPAGQIFDRAADMMSLFTLPGGIIF